MENWREQLVARLHDYATGVTDPGEAAMLTEFGPFVTTHPDCLWRSCRPGHLTASAWIVDEARRHTLLTLHRKLGRWLQLGGHVDGNPDLLAAAQREAHEESGLTSLRVATTGIFDVDVHSIPSRGLEPEHRHFDVRFLLVGDPAEPFTVSDESKELQWVELERVAELNPSESLQRLVRKTMQGPGGGSATPGGE